MKLCAIICEYNPFHNGHKYHIEESLKKSGCDAVLCIMNSNFSQRGEPTIVDKKVRSLMAVAGGASAVVCIPTYFSCTNAETFAMSAVKIACSFNEVTHLSFGSECGDIESIVELANFLYKEPVFYKNAIKKYLSEGYSLGLSKVKALNECINNKEVSFKNPKTILQLLSAPNNILAVEYVRALLKLKNKKITPITVKRQEAYEGYELDIDFKLSSATEIRQAITKSKRIWNIRKYIPAKSYYIFASHLKENNLPDHELWGKIALYKLRTTSAEELKQNYDVVEGFENKLIYSARESANFDDFLERTVSKRYSSNRVKRIIASCLLNLKANVTKKIFKEPLPFVKVVACKKDKKLIASLKNATCPVVMRRLDATNALKNDFAKELSVVEDQANAFYDLLIDLPENKQIKKADNSDIFEKTIFVENEDYILNKTIME